MPNAVIWGVGTIGQAIARDLHARGFRIFAAGRHAIRLADIAIPLDLDVGNPFSVQTAITEIAQEAESLDLWVYAAGDILSRPVKEIRPDAWKMILDANLTGAFLTAQASLPLLSDSAPLFFVGAISERMRLPGLAAYAAAKAGLEAFAEVLRKETRRKVTVLRPGAVDTPFWNKVPYKLPPHPLQPADVAAKLWQAYESGQQGNIDF